MLLLLSSDNALKSEASACSRGALFSAPSQALSSVLLFSLECTTPLDLTAEGISGKEETVAPSGVSYTFDVPNINAVMWLCGHEDKGSFWVRLDRLFLSTVGQGSDGSRVTRCFKPALGGDIADAAAVLQYVNFGGWRMGDFDRRRRWVLEAPLDVFLVDPCQLSFWQTCLGLAPLVSMQAREDDLGATASEALTAPDKLSASTLSFLKAVCRVSSSHSFPPASMVGGGCSDQPPRAHDVLDAEKKGMPRP